MSDLILKNIQNSIYLMPIRAIQFYETVLEDWTAIEHLESGSNFRITSITKQNSKGANVTLGYRVELTANVAHNDYANNGLIERLNRINSADFQLHFKMGYGDDIIYTPPKMINYNNKQKIVIENTKIVMEFESVELRPRMILKATQFIKNLENIFY